jgi:uncharacterized membrane protein YcaP (DUF421 family)
VEIVVRTSVIFFFVWLCLRSLGKRELAEMTAFELVLVMVIGDLVQEGVMQDDLSTTGAMIGVGTIVLWILATSYVSFRFKGSRGLLEGIPAVVVEDGKPNMDVLRIERISIDELLSAARTQGIPSLSDVRLAVLEPEGQFTFIKRDAEQTSDPRKKEPM